MRRKLSLLLAVVMILGSFTFVFADEVDVPAFLKENGILVGNESGDLMLDDYLLRKDAVVLLARLLDKEDEAENFEMEGYPTFTDLAGNPYYNAFLAWAEYNGYFNGRPDGSFGYNDNLEAVEYALVLLRALEYGEDDKAEEWAKAWDLAEELGLLENVEIERRELITRRDVAQMTFNALGVEMKEEGITLAEFLGIELPEEPKPEKLEVVDVYTENLAEVVVELSNADLVKNKEALLNPHNYRINQTGVEVYHVDLDGDNVILTLVPYGKVEELETPTVLTKGKKFNLTIRNIDPAINDTYKNIEAKDNAIPEVVSVDFIGTHGIKVTTSEPIANPLERNFRLDSRTSMIVEQYGRDIILTPYHGKAFDEEEIELTIDILEDFAGYKSVKEVYEVEISEDDALPVVEEAYRSGNKLVVVFDRDVYHDSISAYVNRRVLGNVSFVEKRATFYAEKANKVDTNVVEYIFGREIPKGIEVEIEGVANHFNKAMEKQSIVPVEFKDEYAPVIINFTDKVVVTKAFENAERGTEVDTKNMTITFDKDIAEFVPGKNETKADVVEYLNDNIDRFFTLYELDITRRGELAAEKIVINVEDIDRDTIKLSFKDIKLNNKDRDYDYILEVRNFHDLSGNRMERDYLDFQVVLPSAAFSVELKEINNTRYFNRAGVEIVLEFNDYVDKAEASNAKNYYLVNKEDKVVDLAVNEAIVERDGYTVSLVVYDTNVEKLLAKYDELEISPRVTNADGDSLSQTNRFVKLMNNDKIAANKVIALIDALPAVDEITLENKEDVEKAKKAFAALTDAQKELVSNKDKLEAAVNKIEALDAVTKGYKIGIVYNRIKDPTKFTVSFTDAPEEFPDAIEGFLVDARITVDKKLPEGTKVTVNYGDILKVENVPVGGKTKLLLSELLNIDPQPFVEGIKDDEWNVVITGNLEPIKGEVTFVTVISNDGFETEYVIAERSFNINVPVDEKAVNEALLEKVEEAIGNEITVEVEGDANVNDLETAVEEKIKALEIGEGDDKVKVGEIDGLDIEVTVTEEGEGVKTYKAEITLTIGEGETEATKTIENVTVVVVRTKTEDNE